MKKSILLAAATLILSVFPQLGCGESNGMRKTSLPDNGENIETPIENGNSEEPAEKLPEERDANADVFEFNEQDGYIVITGLKSETETEVVIPNEINGYPVREIKENAFKGNKTLTSLKVPESVEKIGYGILSECENLAFLTLPFTGERHKTEKGLNDYNFGYIFGKTAYKGATATMQFYHKNSDEYVELNYYYIPNTLKEVVITGVKSTHIPYGAFYNCSEIEKITLGKEITSVGEFAFSGVTAKIEWKEPQITTIGEHAFEDFKGTELTIPQSVTEIKKKGYSACVNVKEFNVPDSVSDIDIYAFSYCYDLEKITFGKNVEKVNAETFYFCINLKNVFLPENLKTIEDGAFDSCKSLAEIEIPASVTRINANAFKTCSKLKTARFLDANGWRYYSVYSSGKEFSAENVSNPATAAKFLTNNFREYVWEKI